MALINSTVLLGIADRAAQQYNMLQMTFTDVNQEGSGFYFTRVSETNDPDVELPTVQPYEIVDSDFAVDYAVRNGTQMANIIGAMEVHFNLRQPNGQPLQAGGWDGYLAEHDVRVSWWFNRLYYAVKNRLMLAIDVFSESEDVFGTLSLSAGPTIDFTDGVNYGNGSELNPANGVYYAATQLKVVVGSMGANNLDLRLSVKDVNNLPVTIDVTIPASSAPGTEISVGTTANRYLDLMGASFVPAGSNGTLGDTVTVQNLKERQIAL